MGFPALLASGLALSIATAWLCQIVGDRVERSIPDPVLRHHFWGGALLLTFLTPTVLVALLVTTPPPDRPSATATMAETGRLAEFEALAVRAMSAVDPDPVAWIVLTAAVGLGLMRFASLARRTQLLMLTMRTAEPAPRWIETIVADQAARGGVSSPQVLVHAQIPEPMLCGLFRPRLLLPVTLTRREDDQRIGALVAHELAHLRRNDHRAIWVEEALLVLLAFNPLSKSLRGRREAAREEACDALALGGVSDGDRRAYARALIEILRSRAASPKAHRSTPGLALTFTGAGRTIAMIRLTRVLTPAPSAAKRERSLTLCAVAALFAVSTAATAALAAQREPAPASLRQVQDPPPASQPVVLDIVPVQVLDLVPETARTGEVLRLRTPGGRTVEAWRGQPEDRVGAVRADVRIEGRVGGLPPAPAGDVVIEGSVGAPPTPQSDHVLSGQFERTSSR